MNSRAGGRAQASLPALALALLILSGVTVLSLTVADGALAAADREPNERHVGTAVADRLVAASGPIAVRQNVLDNETLATLDRTTLEEELSVVGDEAIRVSVGDRTVVAAPGAHGGTTIRRIVTVRSVDRRSITPSLGRSGAITLPRRTGRLQIELQPASNATVETVRANGRVLLHDPGGLAGTFDVTLSRFETTRLQFDGTGPIHNSTVELSYPVERTTRTTLAVTVDE